MIDCSVNYIGCGVLAMVLEKVMLVVMVVVLFVVSVVFIVVLVLAAFLLQENFERVGLCVVCGVGCGPGGIGDVGVRIKDINSTLPTDPCLCAMYIKFTFLAIIYQASVNASI